MKVTDRPTDRPTRSARLDTTAAMTPADCQTSSCTCAAVHEPGVMIFNIQGLFTNTPGRVFYRMETMLHKLAHSGASATGAILPRRPHIASVISWSWL